MSDMMPWESNTGSAASAQASGCLSDVSTIRSLAYRALRNDKEANFKLSRLLKDWTDGHFVLDAEALFVLTQPEATNRMPIANLMLAHSGKLVRIDFTPGCMDFEAQSRRVSICA